MGKKTVTKYARRRYYRRYRSVSNRYFPCRVEGVYTIAFPENAGSPLFYDTAGNVSYVVAFANLFRGSQYYGSLVKMFGYYKVIKKNYRKKEIIYLQFQKNIIKNVLNVAGLQKKPLTWKVLINLIK